MISGQIARAFSISRQHSRVPHLADEGLVEIPRSAPGRDARQYRFGQDSASCAGAVEAVSSDCAKDATLGMPPHNK